MWKKIKISTNNKGEELVANTLWENGAQGINIINTNDIIDLLKSDIIWDYVDEKVLEQSDIVTVEGFYDLSENNDLLSDIKQELEYLKLSSDLGQLAIKEEIVDETDWREEWKKHYSPINCGNFVVVPMWINYPCDSDKIIIKINPGAAFGTGEHETTRMCLEFISSLSFKDKIVTDIGTGSGILAIAASKMGAKKVYAYDIDDDALKSLQDNVILNNVNIITENRDLTVAEGRKCDIIIANITADILICLADKINKLLDDNGIIILSGIINKRKEEVKKAYIDCNLKLHDVKNMGEWNAFMFKK